MKECYKNEFGKWNKLSVVKVFLNLIVTTGS